MSLDLLCLIGLLLAASNGANDNFKGFATVWGARCLNFRRALTLATGATAAGSLASLALAAELANRFSGKGLVSADAVASPSFLAAVGTGAAITVASATRIGMPISTTHALIGGLVGAGMARGGVDFYTLGSNFLAPMLVSPLLAAAASYALFLALGPILRAISGGRGALSRAFDGTHLLSAAAISFSRGVNDTPKLAALLLASEAIAPYAAIAVAGAMALGGVLFSRGVAETMSLKISRMEPAQAVLANLVAAFLVLVASRFGLPVSTTHVMVGAIGGAGGGAGTLDAAALRNVLLSWVATLPVAAAAAWAVASFTA